MAQIDYIKHLYEREGKSLRAIARETGLDWRTVQKYAYMNDFRDASEPNLEASNYPVLGPYITIIDSWLEQDQREPRKQRHTIVRIWHRLQDEQGFTGSYASVKRYVGRKRWKLQQEQGRNAEGYLPLSQPAGHAQVDFGDCKYYDDQGEAREGHSLVVSFPYSNAGWIQVFPAENQECLLEGLQRVFQHIEGVPLQLRCDNMRTVVAQVLEGHERRLSEGFQRFKLHYRLEVEFCNPDAGNEKGHVENKVGYSRRNLLVPVPTITDFETYNEELLLRCDADLDREHYRHGVSIRERWDEEKSKLLTLPEYQYEVYRYENLSVGKTGFVTIDGNRYGITPSYSGCIVQGKVYYDRIEIYHEGQMLMSYRRSYGRREEIMDWRQYLPTLLKKPGAVGLTRFYGQVPRLWQTYLQSVRGKERKSALALLNEIVKDGNERMCNEVLELASSSMGGMLDSDSIRQCYLFISKREHHPEPLRFTTDPPKVGYTPDLAAYDTLLLGKQAVVAMRGGGGSNV